MRTNKIEAAVGGPAIPHGCEGEFGFCVYEMQNGVRMVVDLVRFPTMAAARAARPAFVAERGADMVEAARRFGS